MDGSKSAINPRANYKAALDMAGINQKRGIGKSGSRYDFEGALGLRSSDRTQEYQDSKDADAMTQSTDKTLSNADTNYEEIREIGDKYSQTGNLADISQAGKQYRYAVR